MNETVEVHCWLIYFEETINLWFFLLLTFDLQGPPGQGSQHWVSYSCPRCNTKSSLSVRASWNYLWCIHRLSVKGVFTKYYTSTKNSWPSRSQNQVIQPPDAEPSLSSPLAPPGTIPLIFWFCLLLFEYIVKSCIMQVMFCATKTSPSLLEFIKLYHFLYFL